MVRYDKSTAEKGAGYVRDRRDGRRSGSLGGGRTGGGMGRPVGIGGLIIMLLAALLGFGGVFGGDGGSFQVDNSAFPQSGGAAGPTGTTMVDPQGDTTEYMQFLMYDIQETWDQIFEQAGLTYEPTYLVPFDDVVTTGCGQATSDVGPFYCPAPGDNQVYIDYLFFDELASPKFGAAGDFAQAYVIAHEVGHHLQYVLGISDQVRQAQQQDPSNANEYSIRLELQADCLAGVWAHSANNRVTEESGQPILEAGDIQEGLQAAASVGDDRIQSSMTGMVNPETWTHGSSEQRVKWFTTGFDTGDPEMCDTFAS